MNFGTMSQGDVPQGRNGKHKEIVTKLLSDLDQLPISALRRKKRHAEWLTCGVEPDWYGECGRSRLARHFCKHVRGFR